MVQLESFMHKKAQVMLVSVTVALQLEWVVELRSVLEMTEIMSFE